MTATYSIRALPQHLRALASGRFARNVAMITSGAALAQGVSLLSAPLFSRLYTPEEFGMLGLFSALAGVLGSSAALRYDLPIVIARRERTALALFYLCLTIATIMALVALAIVFVWGRRIVALFGMEQLAPYLYWIPLHILASGLFLAMSQWACRHKEFALLARNPLTRTGTTVVVRAGAGMLSLGAGGLIFSAVAGQIAATAGMTARLLRRDRQALRPRKGQVRQMIAAMKRFRDFPQFSAPQELINALSQQMPNFILALFFSPATVGLYWMTVRVLQAPGNFVGQAVRQVFYPRVCDILNQGRNAFPDIAKTTVALLALGAAAFLPILVFGPALFALVFGEPWREAGEYARWVSLWTWFGFANVPAVCGLQAMGAQKMLLFWESALFLCRNGALLLFAAVGGPLQAVAAFALAGMIFNILLILIALKRSAVRNRAPDTQDSKA